MKFSEILTELNIEQRTEGHHHCRPGWIQIDCPFCGKDSQKFHMGYSIENNFLNCWRCSSHNLTHTLMAAAGISFIQARKLLTDLETDHVKIIRKQGRLKIPKGLGELLIPHLNYLKDRGFDHKEIERLWKIRGIGITSKLSWRIYIPIFYKGETVSWSARSISNTEPTRYIFASLEEESVPHKDILYGADYIRHAAIIVEGQTDVWAIGPGAVGTMGTGYSQAQLELISHFPTRAVCFDNQKEAQKRAKKLVDDLSVFPGETFNVELSTGKDPAEASKKEIRQLRKEILG